MAECRKDGVDCPDFYKCTEEGDIVQNSGKNLSFFEAKRDLCIPSGDIGCTGRIEDCADAALREVRLGKAGHIGGRRDVDKERGGYWHLPDG